MGIHIPANYQLPPDLIERNRRFLQQESDTFGLYISYDRIMYHIAHYDITASKAARELLPMVGANSSRALTGPYVREVLSKSYGVPDFKMLKDGRASFDKNVRAALLEDPETNPSARRVLELFQEFSASRYMCSYLRQYIDCGVRCKPRDFENNVMLVCRPQWSVLSTSRFSAKEPSAQNINRSVQDIITAPKGYQLVHSDSGQIEPRITYSAYIKDDLIKQLIINYDDAYFGLLHFILMTDEERERQDVTVKPITADMKAKRQRLKVLGLAGNYGSSNLSAIDPELGPLYDKYIVNHPARRAWESEVAMQVRNGVEEFAGYFGTVVRPDNAQRADMKRGTPAWRSHLIRCGINNPIQTTASELMHISIAEVRNTLRYGEHVAGYIHDAGLFYVPEDSVEERAPVFKECLAYDVEGWIPIGSDLHIGREDTPYAAPIF